MMRFLLLLSLLLCAAAHARIRRSSHVEEWRRLERPRRETETVTDVFDRTSGDGTGIGGGKLAASCFNVQRLSFSLFYMALLLHLKASILTI
jgi:hypothetical protein